MMDETGKEEGLEATGDQQETENQGGQEAVDVSEAPEWFREAHEGTVAEASRQDTCTGMAAWLLGPAGLNQLDALAFLFDWNSRACQPPMGPADVLEVVRSIAPSERAGGLGLAGEMITPLDVEALIQEIRSAPEGLSTGFRSLTDIGVVLRPAELVVVAGRLGSGKTSLLVNMLLRLLASETGALVFLSLENPRASMLTKILAVRLGIDSREAPLSLDQIRAYLRTGNDPNQEDPHSERLHKAVEFIQGAQERIWLLYLPQLRADHLGQVVAQIAREAGSVAVVFVDYLQLIGSANGFHDRRDVEIATVCRALKDVAVDHKCPVVAACQVNRDGTKNLDLPAHATLDNAEVRQKLGQMRPRIHQLREADQIGQFADIVVGLQDLQGEFLAALTAEQREQHRQDSGPLMAYILKNRFGDLRTAELEFWRTSGAIFDPRT